MMISHTRAHLLVSFLLLPHGEVAGLKINMDPRYLMDPAILSEETIQNSHLTTTKKGVKLVDGGPFLAHDYRCNQKMTLLDDGDKHVCVEGWKALQETHKGKPCVAYELGVRTESTFALKMLEDLGCDVRAYDPSPITSRWWKDDSADPAVPKLKRFQADGKYQLHQQAAAKQDGNVTLFAYNWDQVSIFRANEETRDQQNSFTVPAKSYSTMLKDNGDTFIDVMKIDIEGSEFKFLESMFVSGCPNIEYLLFEWHSTNMDYEFASPPEVHEAEKTMKQCGYKKFASYPFYQVDPTHEEKFKIDRTWYGHSSYCRNC